MTDWQKVKFGDLVKDSGYGPRFSASLYSDDGNVQTIRATDISEYGEILYEQAPRAILDDKTTQNHALKRNDLIVITTANCGLSAIFRDSPLPVIPSAYTVKFTLNKLAFPEFMKYLMISSLIQRQVQAYIRKATVANLALADIHKFNVFLPPLPEQQKIAQILSTWDEAIALVETLIAALTERKKGLMQRLLTGEVRFPGFVENDSKHEIDFFGSIPIDWEMARLGEYAYIKARIGWRGLASDEYTEDGPYLIAGSHIVRDKILWEKCDHISEFRYDESPEIQLQEKDVIISKDGTIGRLGYTENMPGRSTINGTMMLIRPDTNFYNKFVYYYLQGEYFQTLIKRRISGSSVPHIFQRDMVKLRIPRPPKDEQEVISTLLTHCDTQIDQFHTYKDQLHEQKKGLMQRLLTGELRVQVEGE
jgi:type I restriction enzyme, S subunit